MHKVSNLRLFNFYVFVYMFHYFSVEHVTFLTFQSLLLLIYQQIFVHYKIREQIFVQFFCLSSNILLLLAASSRFAFF